MPVLPIPMIIALLLAGFCAHRLITRQTQPSLLSLIALTALQGAVIALVQYYGFSLLRPLQAIMATLIPPVAWFAFSRATGGSSGRWSWALHALGPVLGFIFLLASPPMLDVLIPLSFAGYGSAMLLHLWRGEDSLPHASLEHGSTALWAWRILGISLIASAACDVLIAVTLARGEGGLLLWVPSIVSSLSLLSLGALALTHAIESRRDDGDTEVEQPAIDVERDKAIIAKLDSYVQSQKPFLDPDLTLARLSRKLLVPAKQLSTAINRVKGENVSRYINRQRIDEACRRLAGGQSVTAAMWDSGFNTKSNFNREFLRLKNMSPRDWQAGQLSSAKMKHHEPMAVAD